ncbi:glutamyl-tRNA synthetase [Blastocladiella britannica]|nr:glutamyl-tRNA synthetase [Blastocladiella britannica]
MAAAAAAAAAVRVRFAPSPTGSLHLGGLRTALYNRLLARSPLAASRGKFILRIEDTDQSRLVPGATENIIRNLEWAGLGFDEGPGKSTKYGPYVQSQRLDLYRKAANDLVAAGHAYQCYCTPERLTQVNALATKEGRAPGYDGHCRHLSSHEHNTTHRGEPHVIRFKAATAGHTTMTDRVFRSLSVANNTLDDFVLLKSDGWPTYHLASVVDDHLMEISHVLRGHEWLPSLPKHAQLYTAFGWQQPEWVHLPLLLSADGKKLSKRTEGNGVGAIVDRFREVGYSPEALLNFIGLLGWTPPGTKEVLTLEEMENAFSLDRLHISPAVVDFDRLDWLQKTHFTTLVAADATPMVADLRSRLPLSASQGLSDGYLTRVVRLISTRLFRVPDIAEKAPYFWSDPVFGPDSEAAAYLASFPQAPEIAAALLRQWRRPDAFPSTSAGAMAAIATAAKEAGVPKNAGMAAVRAMLTGTRIGAGIGETVVVLGKAAVVRRLAMRVQ